MAQLDELREYIADRWRPGEIFSLTEVYDYVSEFSANHPDNAHVPDKLRQLLQRLRDEGSVEFVDEHGTYRRTR